MGWDNTDAAKGAKQLEGMLHQTKKRGEAALGSIGQGVNFAAAFIGLNNATTLLRKGLDGVKRGLDFNQTLSDSTVGITNVLRRFDGLNKVAARNEAGKALERIIELEPITAGGLQDLVSGFMGTLAASKGVGLQTMQNVELVAKFANAIANAGLPLDQIRQEFRSILTSTITKDSQIAKILGITNEDMNKMRGDGDAIFKFLTAKLGEFGEAGDSATVAFSSMQSALDKGLGKLTVRLFELMVRSAKELTQLLQDPQWVAQMEAAGVDIAKTAESLKEIGVVVLQLLPHMVSLGAKISALAPTLAAVGVAWGAIRVGRAMAETLGWSKAVDRTTASLHQETAALNANTAAQRANAAAGAASQAPRDRRSPVVGADTRGMARGSSIALGLVPEIQAARAGGTQAAAGFASAFRTGLNTHLPRVAGSMNGFGPLLISSMASMTMDRTKGIAGMIGQKMGGASGAAMAPALLDGLTFALAATGPVGAIAAIGLQMVDAAYPIGIKMGEEIDRALNDKKYASMDRQSSSFDVRTLISQGKADEAKQLLDTLTKRAQGAANSLTTNDSPETHTQIQLELDILAELQANWDKYVARSQAGRDQIRQKEEQQTEAQKQQEEERQAALKRELERMADIRALAAEIADHKIDLLPDEQKFGALQKRLQALYHDAMILGNEVNKVRDASGRVIHTPAMRGNSPQGFNVPNISSPKGMEDLANKQRAAGDHIGAERTLKMLREAQALMAKLAATSEAMRESTAKQTKDAAEKQADAAKTAAEAAFKQEVLGLELQIHKATVQTGDAESALVKQLQDELAAKQLAKELQDSINMGADDALNMARERVRWERQASEAVERMQKAKAAKEARYERVADTSILEAQAAGRDRLAAKLQRELDIRREAQQIAEAENISMQAALDIARRRAELVDKIERRNGGGDGGAAGGGGRIEGYKRDERGGVEAARERAMGRVNNARAEAAAKRNQVGSLAGFYGRPGDTFGNLGSGLPSPMAPKAAANAAGPGASNMTKAEASLEEIVKALKKGLGVE